MIGKGQKIGSIYIVAFIMLASYVCLYVSADSNMPLPPIMPIKFTTKEEVLEFWTKINEYYAIIGRPKFGRSFASVAKKSLVNEQDEHLREMMPVNIIIDTLDINHDDFISKQELKEFLSIF